MNEPRVIRTPGGEELVLLTRDQYEDLRDAATAAARPLSLPSPAARSDSSIVYAGSLRALHRRL